VLFFVCNTVKDSWKQSETVPVIDSRGASCDSNYYHAFTLVWLRTPTNNLVLQLRGIHVQQSISKLKVVN